MVSQRQRPEEAGNCQVSKPRGIRKVQLQIRTDHSELSTSLTLFITIAITNVTYDRTNKVINRGHFAHKNANTSKKVTIIES